MAASSCDFDRHETMPCCDVSWTEFDINPNQSDMRFLKLSIRPRTLTLPLPNEDFGRPNQPFRMCFRSTFQGHEYSIWATNRWKLFRTHIRKGWFGLPKSSFGEHRFSKDKQKMKSGFRRKHFSSAWVLDLGHEPLKTQSNIRISSFVPPSKIFVWGA
jgi:hypothetical protein